MSELSHCITWINLTKENKEQYFFLNLKQGNVFDYIFGDEKSEIQEAGITVGDKVMKRLQIDVAVGEVWEVAA